MIMNILVAIDPGGILGHAHLLEGEKFTEARTGSIFITDFGRYLTDLVLWYGRDDDYFIFFIEKMESSHRLFAEHRASANNIINAIKRKWKAKQRKIIIISPRTWQAAVLKGLVDPDIKKKSMISASAIMGREITKDHEADAINILYYGLTSNLAQQELIK